MIFLLLYSSDPQLLHIKLSIFKQQDFQLQARRHWQHQSRRYEENRRKKIAPFFRLLYFLLRSSAFSLSYSGINIFNTRQEDPENINQEDMKKTEERSLLFSFFSLAVFLAKIFSFFFEVILRQIQERRFSALSKKNLIASI